MASLPTETWHEWVTRSAPPAAWLADDGPHREIVLSTRLRVARNLPPYPFPCAAAPTDLEEVTRRLLNAQPLSGWQHLSRLSEVERDLYLSSRLLSPDLDTFLPHRWLLVDPTRSQSAMIHEEDHLRLQVLSPGWNPTGALDQLQGTHSQLENQLQFAHTPRLGFLTSSPSNLGSGQRASALVHLVALAHGKQLKSVFEALIDRGVVVRGLFGESSRGVGAFFQISQTQSFNSSFCGAIEFLLQRESESRAAIDTTERNRLVEEAVVFAVRQREIKFSDALRVLAWVRLAAAMGDFGPAVSARRIDEWIGALDVRSGESAPHLDRRRAERLRPLLEKL